MIGESFGAKLITGTEKQCIVCVPTTVFLDVALESIVLRLGFPLMGSSETREESQES